MALQVAGPAFIGESAKSFIFSLQNGSAWLSTANAGNLYLFQVKNQSGGGNINGSGVFRSTDGGNTWAEMDATDSPLSATGSVFWDVPNRALICGLVTETSPASVQSTFLQNFDLNTETWGAAYATGGPNAENVVQLVFKRPDGSVVIVYDLGASWPGGTTRLRAAVFAAGSWSASIDVGVAILPSDATGNVLVSACAGAMDSTGVIHLIFGNNATTQYCYQALLTDNSLGSSHHFTGLNQSSGYSLGNIAVMGDALFVPFSANTRNNNAVIIGASLAGPVWSVVTPASLTYTGRVRFPGNILANGSTLYWMVNFQDASFTYFGYQIATSTDAGQTWAILPDNIPEPFFYDFTPGESPIAPNADPTFGAQNSTFALLPIGGGIGLYGFANVRNTSKGLFLGYFLNSGSILAPVIPAIKITFRGVKRFECKPDEPLAVLPPVPHVKRAM